MKLAIVTTHPIQYNAPLFRILSKRPGWELMVFYTWSQTSSGSQFEPKFGRTVSWDIPLLDGYPYRFVENISGDPGSHHFRGIVNPSLIREIEAWGPSAVLVYGWSFKSHLACLRHFKGRIPVLFRGDSTLIDSRPGWKSSVRSMALRWVYRHIDIALYTGQANKAYFEVCGLRPAQLVSAPHAIDNHRFGADDAERAQEALRMRKALGIDDGDLVVLFAGKLEPKKDPMAVLRLAKKVQVPGVRFLVVGNGQLEASLKAAAAELSNVLFMDFQNQQIMPVIYRVGDIFLLPSLYNETWGLAVNEAMASGRTAIVSDRVGCAPDLIREDQTGWSFSPGDDGETRVAGLIWELARDRDRLASVATRARDFVRHFSFEAIADAIDRALATIAKHKQSQGA